MRDNSQDSAVLKMWFVALFMSGAIVGGLALFLLVRT